MSEAGDETALRQKKWLRDQQMLTIWRGLCWCRYDCINGSHGRNTQIKIVNETSEWLLLF